MGLRDRITSALFKTASYLSVDEATPVELPAPPAKLYNSIREHMTPSEMSAYDSYVYGSESYGAGSLANHATGQGVPGDPSLQNFWTMQRPLTDPEIQSLGVNAFVRRLMTARPFDALRKGWTEVVDTSDYVDAEQALVASKEFARYHTRLETAKTLRRALSLRSQWGHSIIVAEVADLAPGEKYSRRINSKVLRSVYRLRVFPRPRYRPGPLLPPGHPQAGKPAYYDIFDYERPEELGLEHLERGHSDVRIHHSRVFFFATDTGLSSLQGTRWALERFFSAIGSGTAALNTWSFGKWKIKNLIEKWMRDKSQVIARIRLAEKMTSLFHGVSVDKENEDYEMMGRPMTGFSDVLGMLMQLIPAFYGIPASIVFGADPPGFGNGQALIDRYNATVETEQVEDVSSFLRWIDTLIACAYDGPNVPPDSVSYEFESLATSTAKEQAETRKLNMETVSGVAELLAASGSPITRAEIMAAITGFFELENDEAQAPAPGQLDPEIEDAVAVVERDATGTEKWMGTVELAELLGTQPGKIVSFYRNGLVARRRRAGKGGSHQYSREHTIEALNELVEDRKLPPTS